MGPRTGRLLRFGRYKAGLIDLVIASLTELGRLLADSLFLKNGQLLLELVRFDHD